MKTTFLLGLTASASLLLAGCQGATTTTNSTTANSNLINTNVNLSNANVSNANFNSTTTMTSTGIEATEPEKYQAKVQIRLETSGATQKGTVPPLTAMVARDGQNRRMEFTLPNAEKIIYLDVNGKNYIIAPNRKQYAEVTKEEMGFDIKKLMMPEQIITRIKEVKGVERVGEEKLNNRDVIKYLYGSTTNTQTQAGQVNTESFIIVDKETGLPLRSETVAQSQNGQVQGMNTLRVVTEMSDISTNVTPDLFAEPTDLQKVDSKQIRDQLTAFLQIAGAFVGQLMNQAQAPPPPPATMAPKSAAPAGTPN